MVGGFGRHNGENKGLPGACEGVENSAFSVFVLYEIALGVLAAGFAAAHVAHALCALSQNAADGLGNVYAVVEFVHAGSAEHVHHLAALLFRQRQELLHFVSVARAGRAEDHRAVFYKLFHAAAVGQISHQRLVDEHRLALLDERHCAAQMVVPVAAVDEADVAHRGKLLQRIAALF